VLYLGANQNAWSVGATMGIVPAQSMDFAVGSVREAMQSAGQSMGRYRKAVSVEVAKKSAAFTDAERAASLPSQPGTKS